MTKNAVNHRQWKNTAQAHFHRWAEHYDRDIINILLFRPSYRRVLTLLRHWRRRGQQRLRLLDIGAGTGTLMLHALKMHTIVETAVGLDMSQNMLSKARQKIINTPFADRAHLILGDAEHLAFEDNYFDIITCCNSFHHYPHKSRAVAEMYRVLRPDGRLIIIDGSRDDPCGYFIFEICVARVENHVYHCTRREFRELLTQTGFTDIVQNVFGLCPPALLNVARAAKS